MRAQIHNVEQPSKVASSKARAPVTDERPAAAAQANLQKMADASAPTRQLQRLQAQASEKAVLQKKSPTSAPDGVVQRLGEEGGALPFGPEDFLLLVVTIRFLSSVVGRVSGVVYNRLAGDHGVQAEVSAVRQDESSSTRDEQAASLAPFIASKIEDIDEATVHGSPGGASGAVSSDSGLVLPSSFDVAGPPSSDVAPPRSDVLIEESAPVLDLSSSLLPPIGAMPTAATLSDEEAIPDELASTSMHIASSSSAGTGKSRGRHKPSSRRRNETKEESSAAASSSGPLFSDDFIASYEAFIDELDDMGDEMLNSVGLGSRSKIAAYREHLASETALKRKAERAAILGSEDLMLDRARTGKQQVSGQMDAELALVYAARKPSGEHYVTWTIDGVDYHVTVRGGDTKHVTREGKPEIHYYFEFSGTGAKGTLPTSSERGSSGDQYKSLDVAPAKVRRFIELYIGMTGAGALFR